MNAGKTVFAQILEHLPRYEFDKFVKEYEGNRRVRKFPCYDQFLCLAYAQLTYRESLRDIETCLNSHHEKLYHIGFRGQISRSTMADAGEMRDYRIYQDFAYHLISIARKLYQNEELAIDLAYSLYAFDSTTIDLCLSLFPWANFRKTKAAIKMHTLLDLRGSIPTFISLTTGKVHDVNVLDILPLEKDSVIAIDRGYVDFTRFYTLNLFPAFFVIRAKGNFRCRRLHSQKVDKTLGLRSDQRIVLTTKKSRAAYPEALRRVSYVDLDTNKRFVYLTNIFTVSAKTVADIYKQLWQVGASSQGRIIQSVKVRPRLKDSMPRSLEGAVARKQDGEALRQHSLKGGCATHQVVTYSERRRSLVTSIPVAETVYNARRQQEMTAMSQIRHFSPAGYQRRHGAKDHAETGEALDARRRNLDEEFRPITLNGKWQEWRQGGGSGRTTVDPRAAKRAGREGPGPVDIPFGKVRQG